MMAVNDATLRDALQEHDIALVDFGAVWCPPCKVLLPILEELDREYGDKAAILKVDCDESPSAAAEYGVMSMPTVILFHKGEPVDKLVGLRPKGVYAALLQQFS